MASKKLKKAILEGKVTVKNPTAGEVKVFLYHRPTDRQVPVIIPPYVTEVLAPKYCAPEDISLSMNLNTILSKRQLQVI